MYCNKCGKEIADDVSFCTSCGTKVDRKQPENEKLVQVSVCSKCGQNADTNMKFCNHCGGEIIKKDVLQVVGNGKVSESSNSTVLNDSAKSFVAFIGAALMGILAILYLVTAIKGFEGNNDAFEWIEDSYKILGIFLHWGICAISVAECMNCVAKVFKSEVKGKYLIGTSFSMLMTTIMIWIGTLIWNDFNFEDLSIVLYRIFGTYGQLLSKSFVITIIVFICGMLCAKSEQK